MNQEMTNFEKKIVDFLTGHYSQQLVDGHQSTTEAKRLSKAKNDIATKIINSMDPLCYYLR